MNGNVIVSAFEKAFGICIESFLYIYALVHYFNQFFFRILRPQFLIYQKKNIPFNPFLLLPTKFLINHLNNTEMSVRCLDFTYFLSKSYKRFKQGLSSLILIPNIFSNENNYIWSACEQWTVFFQDINFKCFNENGKYRTV